MRLSLPQSWAFRKARSGTVPSLEGDPGVAGVLLGGVGLAVLQVVLFCLLGGSPNLGTNYRNTFGWDSFWYANIVDNGYRSTFPPDTSRWGATSNVSFFPAYPALGTAVKGITGLSTPGALRLTAQLAAAVFWIYLLLLMRRWRIAPPLRLAVGAVILVHPAAFFLVAAYAESLFLAALVGMIVWLESASSLAWPVAAAHGFAMTATRLAGLPAAAYPLWLSAGRPGRGGNGRVAGARALSTDRCLLTGGIAALGGLLFFAYCQWRFGAWGLYFQSQTNGWKFAADYLWPIHPSRYLSELCPWRGSSDAISRATLLGTLLLLGVCLALEFTAVGRGVRATRGRRLALYFCAASMLYVSAAGMASRNMLSMARHCFPSWVLLMLAGAELVSGAWSELRKRKIVLVFLAAGFVLVCLFLLHAQKVLIFRFGRGLWAA